MTELYRITLVKDWLKREHQGMVVSSPYFPEYASKYDELRRRRMSLSIISSLHNKNSVVTKPIVIICVDLFPDNNLQFLF